MSSAQTTTTRIESSVFIPVSSTGSADGVVQALVEAIKDQGIEVESFTFDPETGELSYVVKIVNYAGSGSQSLENTIEGALEQEGIDNDDVTHGTSKTTSEDTVVQNLIDAIEEQDGVEIETYTYDSETGEFEYTIKVTISDLAPASGSGSAKVSLVPLDVVSDVINDTLEKEGIDDVTYGSPEVTQTTEPTGESVDEDKLLEDISTGVQDAFADALKDF